MQPREEVLEKLWRPLVAIKYKALLESKQRVCALVSIPPMQRLKRDRTDLRNGKFHRVQKEHKSVVLMDTTLVRGLSFVDPQLLKQGENIERVKKLAKEAAKQIKGQDSKGEGDQHEMQDEKDEKGNTESNSALAQLQQLGYVNEFKSFCEKVHAAGLTGLSAFGFCRVAFAWAGQWAPERGRASLCADFRVLCKGESSAKRLVAREKAVPRPRKAGRGLTLLFGCD